ncbi:MAG: toast rack family protein [Pseudonocardiaceae bacterium]
MRSIAGWTLALLTLVGGCVISDGIDEPRARVGELQTESRSVERQGADSMVANVAMGAGQLRISGGAQSLLDARFVYNVPDWRPIVEYNVNGGEGNLIVRQPDTDRVPPRTNIRYEWDLRLRNDVPTDLAVDLGAGQSNLDLRGIDLAKLDLETGAGQAMVDLTGDWRRDVTATIDAGVGQLTLRLPENVGARVEVDRGIGVVDAEGLRRDGDAYVNDAFGETAVTMRVMVNAGIGKIDLEVGG